MKTILKVTILCVICAVTMMAGCLEVDDSVEYTEEQLKADQEDYTNYTYSDNDCIVQTIAPIPSSDPISKRTPETMSSIPDDYYNITVDQYFIDYKLYNYLDDYTWGRPVSVGLWSFREAAELEHDLTEKGCNVKIRWADCKTTIDHADFEKRVKTDGYDRWGGLPEMDQVSCWLMIELHDEWVAYSPTHCCWIFEPNYGKNEYVSNGKWHNNWYYIEGTTSTWNGYTWTSYNFIDFDDIYELEDYYMSGKMQARNDADTMDGIWWTYFGSDKYNTTDDFMISFGWWMTDEEYRATETRINTATDWFVLVE